MAGIKAVLFRRFELILIAILLFSLLAINFFIVNKYAFLQFYFLPVFMAGFYLTTRDAVLTALLSIAFVVYSVLVLDGNVNGAAEMGFWNIVIWASFLILSGVLVGRLQERNGRQVLQLREAYLGIVAILTKFLESADAYTKSHSERVAAVSVVLAEKLGLDQVAVQNVWTGALLHDIGKIEVIELIQKAAALSPAEKAAVDSHTELGAQLLLSAGTVLQEAIPVVLSHHQPYHHGGDAIPVGARIVSVADAYDSIVSDRPYRAGRTHWQAIEVLRESAGTQFDPKVVEAIEAAGDLVQAVYEGK